MSISKKSGSRAGQDQDLVVKFIQPPKWWKRTQWELREPFLSSGGGILVPAGFISDGASVPWLFRLFVPPVGKAMPAAVVHDYLLNEGRLSWSSAANDFHVELLAYGVSQFRAGLIVGGVRMWGLFRK